MTNYDLKIRKATAEDAGFLADIRIRQLLDEGSKMIYDTRQDMIDFYREKITDGSYIQFIGEVNGEFASTAGLLFQDYPPSIGWLGAKRGYVSSVYTSPEYRRRGYAKMILREIKDEARMRGLGNLWMLASSDGRYLYRDCGFDDERPGRDVYMEWYEQR